MHKRFDLLAKKVLEYFLRDLGAFEVEKTLLAESQRIDAWFRPAEGVRPDLRRLGLLGRMAFCGTEALFEPYSSNPDADDVRDCLEKLYCLHRLLRASATGGGQAPELPKLWVLSPGVPAALLEKWSLSGSQEWGEGVYLSNPDVGLNLVVLSQLPGGRDTLALRLLGRGVSQHKALAELLGLPHEDIDRDPVVTFVSDLKMITVQKPVLEPEEEEFAMNVQQTYAEYEDALIQRSMEQGLVMGGIRSTRANVIEVYEERFGACPERLRAKINQTNDLELLQRWLRLAVRASAPEFEAQVLAEPKSE